MGGRIITRIKKNHRKEKMKKTAVTIICVLFLSQAHAQDTKSETPAAPEKKESWGFGGHPIIGYDSKSSLTIGAGAVVYFDPDNPNQDLDEIEIHSTYNLKKQYDIMTGFSKYFKDNFCCLEGVAGYQNYPDDYLDMDYDAVFLPLELSATFKFSDIFYFGPVYKFQYSDIDFDNENANRTVRGAGKKYSSGAGAQLTIKNLPKGQHYRREGNIFTTSFVYHAKAIGSSYDFTTGKADYRHYIPLFGQCVLAFQVSGKACWGNLSFNDIPDLEGKDILRGGSEMSGKYMFAGQTEFRFPVYWRFGAAVFVGAGEAENRRKDLFSDASVAGGIGIRVTLNRAKNINMRFDFAINEKKEKSIYIKIKEAF